MTPDTTPPRPDEVNPARALLDSVAAHGGTLAFLLLVIVVEVALLSTFSLTAMYVLDVALPRESGGFTALVMVGLITAFLGASVAAVGREHLASELGGQALLEIRERLFAHLQTLSAGFYARREMGDMLAKHTDDLAAVESGLVRGIPLGIYGALGLATTVVLHFVLDWRLALVTGLVIPFAIFGPAWTRRWYARWQHDRQEAQQASAEEAAAAATSPAAAASDEKTESAQKEPRKRFTLSFVSTPQPPGVEPAIQPLETPAPDVTTKSPRVAELSREEKITREAEVRARSVRRTTFLERLSGQATHISTMLGELVILGVGIYLVTINVMTLGKLTAFAGLLVTLVSMVGHLATALPSWRRAQLGMRKVLDVLAEQPQVKDADDAEALPRIQKEIGLDRVSFSYTGERLDLAGVSAKIPAGAKVAFVGRGASGKSTVFNLLARFHEPKAGSIQIDGKDLRGVTQASLWEQMGIVFQDPFLFKGSVRENILVGKPSASPDEIEAAARAAGIHEQIMSWPLGYDSDVGDRGVRLTTGQRQMVALARAILRDPAILLLDDPTGSLDPVAEVQFNQTLQQVGRGRTVVQVTHRLTSAVSCDRIYVLDKGSLVEAGTHGELMLRRNSVYAQLWRQQHDGLTISDDGRTAAVTPQRLRTMPLFSDDEIDDAVLDALATRFNSERWAENRTLFEQGDPGDKFYVIAHGSVEVIRKDENGQETRIAELREGEVFGEMALLTDEPRTATLRTRTPCLLLTLSRSQFQHMLRATPRLRAAVERLAAQRARPAPLAPTTSPKRELVGAGR